MCAMARGDGKKKRQPGNDESLPSGSIRVRVYAGIDPVTNTARYLRETVPPGPNQKKEVERVKAEFSPRCVPSAIRVRMRQCSN
jgi:integrase